MREGSLVRMRSDWLDVCHSLFRQKLEALKEGTTKGSPSYAFGEFDGTPADHGIVGYDDDWEGTIQDLIIDDLNNFIDLLNDLQNKNFDAIPVLCVERKPSGKPDVRVRAAKDKCSPVCLLTGTDTESALDGLAVVTKVLPVDKVSKTLLFRDDRYRFDSRFLWRDLPLIRDVDSFPSTGALIQIVPTTQDCELGNLWFMSQLFEEVS